MSTRETFDRATIYVAFNSDLRARRRKSTGKCSLASGGKDNCFPRRCTGDAYVWCEGRTSIVAEKAARRHLRRRRRRERGYETRRSPAVTCTRARTHARKHVGRHADTRGCERKGVVGDGRESVWLGVWSYCPCTRMGWLFTEMQAWVFFFPRDGETGGGRRGESPRGDSADDAIPDATLRRAD